MVENKIILNIKRCYKTYTEIWLSSYSSFEKIYRSTNCFRSSVKYIHATSWNLISFNVKKTRLIMSSTYKEHGGSEICSYSKLTEDATKNWEKSNSLYLIEC